MRGPKKGGHFPLAMLCARGRKNCSIMDTLDLVDYFRKTFITARTLALGIVRIAFDGWNVAAMSLVE